MKRTRVIFKNYSLVDIFSALALFLIPWQARWIYGQYLLSGQQYEYGALGIYANSVFLIIAVVLLLRERSWRIRLGRPAWILLGWLLLVVALQVDTIIGLHSLGIALVGFGYALIALYWKRELVMRTIVVSGIVQTAIAWQQLITQHVSASTLLGIAEHDPETAGQSVVIVHGLRTLRAYGSTPHPNILGGLLVICFAFAVYEVLQYARHRNAVYLWKPWALRLSALLFLFSGILLTFSRTAIVSVALLLLCWSIFAYLLQQKNFFRPLARVSMYCLLLFIVFNAVAGGIWMQRFGIAMLSVADPEQNRLEQVSVDERIVSYHQSAILAKPSNLIKGVGLGGFVPTLERALPHLNVYAYQPTHNAFILMVLEIGVAGAALYLWFIMHLLNEPWQTRRSDIYWQYLISVVGLVAFMGFFDHFLWTQLLGQSLWWVVVGIAANRRTVV